MYMYMQCMQCIMCLLKFTVHWPSLLWSSQLMQWWGLGSARVWRPSSTEPRSQSSRRRCSTPMQRTLCSWRPSISSYTSTGELVKGTVRGRGKWRTAWALYQIAESIPASSHSLSLPPVKGPEPAGASVQPPRQLPHPQGDQHALPLAGEPESPRDLWALSRGRQEAPGHRVEFAQGESSAG